MKKVICFGEVLWDNFQTGKRPGGAPMNVALHLAKNEIKSIVVSSVGDDTNGKELINFLHSQNVSTARIQINKTLPTGIVEVQLDENQQATYTIVKPVAWDEIQYTETIQHEMASADAILFGSLACRSQLTRETLFKLLPSAKLKVLDLNLRAPHYDELTHIVNLYQLPLQGIEGTLKNVADITGLKTICVTLGDKGAIVYHKQQLYKHAGYKVKVADTVGSGDAFLATFLAGYLKGTTMDKNLARSCAAGALVASRHGANPEYSMEEIDSVISE
jgi:fructokinase